MDHRRRIGASAAAAAAGLNAQRAAIPETNVLRCIATSFDAAG
jgi:hypothetical protein